MNKVNVTFSRIIGERVTNKEIIKAHLYVISIIIGCAIAEYLS